jgi:hypothetical protein
VRVLDRARVYEQAQVSGDAQVYDRAWVFGDAWVSGNARLAGKARVFATEHFLCVGPLGSRKTTLTAYRAVGGIGCSTGCFSGPFAVFHRRVLETYPSGHMHREAYLCAIEFIKRVLARV